MELQLVVHLHPFAETIQRLVVIEDPFAVVEGDEVVEDEDCKEVEVAERVEVKGLCML